MKLYELSAGAKFTLKDDKEKQLLKFFSIVNMSVAIQDVDGNEVLGIPPYADVEVVTNE